MKNWRGLTSTSFVIQMKQSVGLVHKLRQYIGKEGEEEGEAKLKDEVG